ncbi:ATP-binding protein [Streptomyces peucetius]|uniref:ATP-binding protein n=1 Tax=Streptomyces peucetius TaxID=1950 RepID=A0ABY6IFB7_STRPE|nr:ATP-binding protein [Streptomyces peucetius]UYQ65705.1 ATP-binding protein [Streptomyces peucetius]
MTTVRSGRDRTVFPLSAAETRDEVRRLLEDEFCPMPPGPEHIVVVTDALLVASELATNAFRHAGGVTALTLSVTEGALRLSVTDRSPVRPRMLRAPDALVPGGHGWPLVHRLSEEVTITSAAEGKTIHAIVRLAD